MIVEMTQDGDGVWQYDDPNENDMVFELEAISGHELTSYDVLLNDVAQWAGHEKAHTHLVGLRTDLAYKFKRYFDDTEALEMAVQSYWLALQAVRMNISGKALETKTNQYSASQSDRRTGKTKLTESEKKQVVREYEAASVTYGMVKSLARKFDVSDDTISRIVKLKPIQSETNQD